MVYIIMTYGIMIYLSVFEINFFFFFFVVRNAHTASRYSYCGRLYYIIIITARQRPATKDISCV